MYLNPLHSGIKSLYKYRSITAQRQAVLRESKPTDQAKPSRPNMDSHQNSAVLYRNLNTPFLSLLRGKGLFLELENGLSVIDASGGAAVACIGHGDQRVRDAIVAQLDKVAYCSTLFYTADVCEKLCQELVSSTKGHMSRAYIVSSGRSCVGTSDETQAADIFFHRIRGHGGCDEASTAVLPRETPT